METCGLDLYKLSVDQIPGGEQLTLYFKQNDETLARHPCLLDGGSTISAMTPKVADIIIKQLGIDIQSGRRFMVENAGQEDVAFDGRHLLIPTLIPNTKRFEEIKYFIMPHNECIYGIILGDNDSEKLNYRKGLEVEYGKVLYKHRGDNRKRRLERVEKANSIMERIANYPAHVLNDSYIECYQKEKAINEDSFSDDGDSVSATEESSDEDSEDGIRRSH